MLFGTMNADAIEQRAMAERWFRMTIWFLLSLTVFAYVPFGYILSAQTANRDELSRKKTSISLPATKSDAKASPGPSTVLLKQARDLLHQGKWDDAEVAIRRYLAEVPDSTEGSVMLGFVLFQKNQPGDSLLALKEVAKPNVTNAFVCKIMGLDYAMLEQYSEADKWMTKGLKLQPKDTVGWAKLGDMKSKESQPDSALTCYQKSVAIDPRNVYSQNAVGAMYEIMGREQEAIAAYRKAVSLQLRTGGTDPTPYYNLGRLLLEQHQSHDALPYLIHAAQAVPESSEGHEQLSKAYASLNLVDEAEREMKIAITLAPDNPALHFQLGRLYQKQGQTEDAKREFDRVKALSTTNAVAPN